MKKQKNLFIVAVILLSVMSLNACSVADDSEPVPASYKINASNEQFATNVLSSIKSAISSNNNQFFLYAINRYLIENQFTNRKGEVISPPDRNTRCSGFFSGPGTLSNIGDIQSGQLTFTDFCLGFQNESGINKDLVINGNINYQTNVPQQTTLITYDILVSGESEQHIYFGDVDVKLFDNGSELTVNPYTDQNGVTYNTDRLQVKGDLTQGYSINGSIDIGDQGSIGIQTSNSLVYNTSCGTTPVQGKLNVTTTDISISMQAVPTFCQIRLCSSPIDSTLEACTVISI